MNEELNHLIQVYRSQCGDILLLGSETDNLLRLRDRIEELLNTAPDNAQTRRARQRVAKIDERLREQGRVVVRNLENPAHYRHVLSPARSRWWWFLDEDIEKERQQRFAQTAPVLKPAKRTKVA
jgi:hypothetical protein